MRLLFLCCALWVCGVSAYAQALQTDSAAFTGKVSIGGTLNRGNFEQLGLASAADLAANTAKGRFGLVSHSQYNYTRVFGKTAQNDLLTRTVFYRELHKHWYATLVVWYETNELRQLHPLVQAGPSLEYMWLLKKDNIGGISLGVTAEHKHFDKNLFNEPLYDGSNTINVARLFARMRGQNKIGVSKIALVYDFYYMPALNYFANYRVQAKLTLDVPVAKHFSLHIGTNYNYESVVIIGVESTDFFTTYGISINF